MSFFSHDLKLVIINNPLQNWSDPIISHLFHQLILLKQSGYERHYINSVLPIDTTDFIATHVLLCVNEKKNFLKPIMGYKSTTLALSDHYNLIFPGLNLVKQANAKPHIRYIESLIETCRRQSRNLAYLASWTVDHNYKAQYNFKNSMREIFMATYFNLYKEQSVTDVIIGGTLRFGTERIFAQLGHKALQLETKILDPIQVRHLANEPVLVMHANDIPQNLQFVANKWQNLWKERQVIQVQNNLGNFGKKPA